MTSNAKVKLWNNKLCVILSTDYRFGPTASVEPKRGRLKATTFIFTHVKSYGIIEMHVHVHTHTKIKPLIPLGPLRVAYGNKPNTTKR